MKLNFYLNGKANKEGERTISLFISEKGERLQFKTGLTINPKYWDSKKQRVKKLNATNRIDDLFNKRLESFKNVANDIYYSNPSLTCKNLRSELHDYFYKRNQFEGDLLHCYNQFLELNNFKKGTIKSHKTTINKIKEFAKDESIDLDFHNVDLLFFDRLKKYLSKKGLEYNTVSKYTRQLKTFLNWCNDKKITEFTFLNKISVPEKDKEVIYLTKDELGKINEYIPKKEHLKKVKDVFIFSILTGQRYSDIYRISWDDIDLKNGVWELLSKKTEKVLTIPLTRTALSILNKYRENKKPLPVISSQKYNKHLKELCKRSGIDDLIKQTKYINGETKVNRVEKYKLITSHTARRTFVTLAKNKAIPNDIIKAYTGHTTDKMLYKYDKMNKERLLNNKVELI